MTEKRYIIDVEDENYENAVFCGEEFICYEDDSEQLVNELNKLSSDKELLNIDYKNCLDYNRTLINENEQLKETIKELELENAKHIGDGEWDIRDITYGHGKFRLEEWGERYHQFYDGDKPLEDEEVVSLLFENEQLKQDYETLKLQDDSRKLHQRTLEEENEQLKSDNKEYIKGLDLAKATSQSWASDVRELREENCRLEKKNERLIKKIKRERASTTKQHLKWSDEAEEIINDLRRENEQLKKLISKIDFALIRKYDNSLENILDEIYSGEYDKWIQKQVKRSFDLE